MKYLAVLALLAALVNIRADGLEKRLGGGGGGGVSFNANPGTVGFQSSLPNIINTLTSGILPHLSGSQGMSAIGNLLNELTSGIIPPMCGAQAPGTGITLGVNGYTNTGSLGGLLNSLWHGLNQVASNIPQTLLPSINPSNMLSEGLSILNQLTSGIFHPLSGAITGGATGGITGGGETNSGSLGGSLGSPSSGTSGSLGSPSSGTSGSLGSPSSGTSGSLGGLLGLGGSKCSRKK